MAEQFNWMPIGILATADFPSEDIGIYKAILNGDVVYIGKATELENGGFQKRLRDFTRSSLSARKCPSGEKMYRYRNEILIEIIVFPRNKESIQKIKQEKTRLIKEIQPIWNEIGK